MENLPQPESLVGWKAVVLACIACSCTPGPPFVAPTSPDEGPIAKVSPEPRAEASPEATGCNGLEHLYRPQRLQVLNPCVAVTGKVHAILPQRDGADHINIDLDPGQTRFLNAKNDGVLVLELVCMHPATQQDAKDACDGYRNPQPLPRIGQHLRATGPWVLDLEHGWYEVHPGLIA